MDEGLAKRQVVLMELKVEDVMRKDIVTVGPDVKMTELREIMSNNRISGTPVVSEVKELLGVISIEDLIRWLSSGSEDYTVAERMTADPECVYSDQPLTKVITLIDKFGYGRFPVIDRKTRKVH